MGGARRACAWATRVSQPELASQMMSLKQPYNVNVAADAGARAAIAHFAEIKETIASHRRRA